MLGTNDPAFVRPYFFHSLGSPDETADKISVSDFKYVVFNAGPRVCLGRPLAYLEMQLMIGLLLPRYTFTLIKPHDGKYIQTIVAPLKDGFKVKVGKRK